MIVADSSALCAVLFNEPERSAFQAILDGDERCIVSAVNAHETACVLRSKLGQAAVVEFWQWLTDNRIEFAGVKRATHRRRSRATKPSAPR
jgi:ribonuclease VapC